MSARKKIVLIWAILQQLLILGVFLAAIIGIIKDPNMDKLSVFLENKGVIELIEKTGSGLGPYSFVAIFVVAQVLIMGGMLIYMSLNKFLQSTYKIVLIIFRYVWWTIFILPLGVAIYMMLFVVFPLYFLQLLYIFLPIVPGLVYVFCMDKVPKEQYTYSE